MEVTDGAVPVVGGGEDVFELVGKEQDVFPFGVPAFVITDGFEGLLAAAVRTDGSRTAVVRGDVTSAGEGTVGLVEMNCRAGGKELFPLELRPGRPTGPTTAASLVRRIALDESGGFERALVGWIEFG